MMITYDEDGKRQYSLNKLDGREDGTNTAATTKSAHPARFSPDDKQFKRRLLTKYRYNLASLDNFVRASALYHKDHSDSLLNRADVMDAVRVISQSLNDTHNPQVYKNLKSILDQVQSSYNGPLSEPLVVGEKKGKRKEVEVEDEDRMEIDGEEKKKKKKKKHSEK
jgi:H/ACA ribonucleoprotein complex subunit 3